MAIDPRNLRPADLCRLLNSTPLGEVINERQLYRHRTRAGFRIGDGKAVDLIRYVAWLVQVRHAPKPAEPAVDPYEKMKEIARARNAALSLAGRDIGELPALVDADRREQASRSFQFFCESYFPQTFHLEWSADHLKVIGKIEQAVLRGGLFAMAMPRGSGKALALDTPLPTPAGWTTMGDVRVGDELFDENGNICRVTFATGVMQGRDCYRVAFSDHECIVCDGDHLWTVEDCFSRRNPLTLSTRDMAPRTRIGNRPERNERRYRIPLAGPLRLPICDVPFDPYTFGVWLGDGTCQSSIVTLNWDDAWEIREAIEESDETLSWRSIGHDEGNCRNATLTRTNSSSSFKSRLREMKLLGDKHIPQVFLRSSFEQRLSLLQGLMDTDGYVDANGHCEIVIKYWRFADNFGELLSSLGVKFGRSEKWVCLDGREHGPYQRFSFVIHDDLPIFRLQRKLERLKPMPRTRPLCKGRKIVAIEPVPSVPVRCIQVDALSQLYLAGRKMVPTHNTTLAECACLWAVLFGHRDFICLIGSDEGHAMDMLESIKSELDGNDLLLDDFPEVVFPIQALDGIANRCAGQLYNGERTHIGWTAKEIVLPTIAASAASGAIIKVAGITGRIRGMKFKRPDGRSARPSLVVLDDPQTDESARSLSQCANRESVLAGAVLGLAGPGRKISGIMPCTVIRPGDMADNILNRDKHPEWNGERTKMVYSFPTNESLWNEYAGIRAEGLRAGDNGESATRFYEARREEMDEGAVVAWPVRFNYDELSAIQHAMNLKLQDEAAFFAEYQNEPLPEETLAPDELTADQIAGKLNGMKRGEAAVGCNHVTAFIDIQQRMLFYVVCAWEADFTGYVVDYGSYPDQRRGYFTLRDARLSLTDAHPGTGLEGSIYAGLDRLTDTLLAREWRRDDGATLRIERCLIDANWGQSTDLVYQFCRQSKHAALVMPSHGRFIGAASRAINEVQRRPGDRVGLNWRIPNVRGKRSVRHVAFDANFWKSFIHARFAVAMGDRGCLSLFGDSPQPHRLFSEHLTAEFRVRTEGRGRTVDEWKIRPAQFDNHWLDCLVGCAIAASIQGASLPGIDGSTGAKRERVSFSKLQRNKRR